MGRGERPTLRRVARPNSRVQNQYRIRGLWTPFRSTIDGKTVTVEKGSTVLQAAIETGIEVPTTATIPASASTAPAGSASSRSRRCRSCRRRARRPVADGMVVHTQTPDVVEARAGVFEFLLINHPLDCPVCDKGGECPLQDFSYDSARREPHGVSAPHVRWRGRQSRCRLRSDADAQSQPVHPVHAVHPLHEEVDGDAQIGITDRGDGSEIATFKEEGVHSLLSGNLMDVCPVGAITTRDYRFKSRPWDNPDAVDTICTLCSKGCNTTAWIKAKPEWAKGAQMARITPRFNPDVNSYWMCDIGRFDYHWVEGDRGSSQPLVRAANGVQQPANWHDALARAPRARAPAADRRPSTSLSRRTRRSRNCSS